MAPAAKTTLPELILPALLPGATVPPLLTVTAAVVPTPARVPPLLTVTGLVSVLPLRSRKPLLIVTDVNVTLEPSCAVLAALDLSMTRAPCAPAGLDAK